MDKKASNFRVDSKGYCFFCLNKISPQFLPVKPDNALDNSSPAIYSLQDISRYLKMDMRKVFIEEGPLPLHLLAMVENSRLKAELCEGCGILTEDVSKLCRQLEKLKLEIESGLETIHGKIFESNQSGMTEQFRRVAGSGLSSGIGGWMEILEALRMEAMQKCCGMIKTTFPRLQIQKLTSKDIHKVTSRNPKKETEISSSEQIPDSGFQTNNIKMEKLDTVPVSWMMEDDNQGENLFVNDFNAGRDDSVPEIVKKEWEPTPLHQTNIQAVQNIETSPENILQRNWNINPETGKLKCQHCTMEYVNITGFDRHYNSVHRKVRIKCKTCGRLFTQQHHYLRHHQSVHMGIRFQCQVCQKTFPRKDKLTTHQRKVGCRIVMEQRCDT